MNRGGGLPPRAHRENHRRSAGDDVAAGEDAALGGAGGFGVGNNLVAFVGLEIRSGALDERIGGGAYADDGYAGGQNELRAFDFYG